MIGYGNFYLNSLKQKSSCANKAVQRAGGGESPAEDAVKPACEMLSGTVSMESRIPR
jgi:hypothetical protein